MTGALSKEGAAAYLGGGPITVRTIDGLIRRREIAFVRIGRETVITTEALDAYLADHVTRPEETPWGLTPAALRHVREARPERSRRRAS